MLKRPELNSVPLTEVLPARKGQSYVTMSTGYWDSLLQSVYLQGFILLELDNTGTPVRAYQLPQSGKDEI